MQKCRVLLLDYKLPSKATGCGSFFFLTMSGFTMAPTMKRELLLLEVAALGHPN